MIESLKDIKKCVVCNKDLKGFMTKFCRTSDDSTDHFIVFADGYFIDCGNYNISTYKDFSNIFDKDQQLIARLEFHLKLEDVLSGKFIIELV